MSEKISLRFSIWIAALIFVLSFGVYCAYLVFTIGLGVTAMNNMVPWGIWITDYMWHIAAGTGGFMVAGAVYIFGYKKFSPIVRLAVVISLLDYVIGVISLIPDLGRPLNIYYVYTSPNFHSMFFEVILSVTIYTLILVVENAETAFASTFMANIFKKVGLGRIDAPKISHKIHSWAPILAVLGLSISLLHQSSFGGVFAVMQSRPYTFLQDLPIRFIISAMAAGPAIIIWMSIVTSKVYGRVIVKMTILEDLGRISMFFLIGWAFLSIWNMYQLMLQYKPLRTDFLVQLQGTLVYLWPIEIMFGAVVPIALYVNPKTRRNNIGLIVASTFTLFGAFIFRYDTVINSAITTYLSPFSITAEQLRIPLQPSIWTYFPAWPEWGLLAGIFALWALCYTLAIRWFPILPKEE